MLNALRVLLSSLILFSLFAVTSTATEKYAADSGRECGTCHISVSGGGELTAAGKGYAQFLGADAPEESDTALVSLPRALRLLTGYLHTLFAFFWFGTILYVHLILKPAYASSGLPRGEVRLGLVAMAVMGITGALLFVDRVSSVAGLVDSRFGILLLIKIALYLIMVATALVAVFILGPRMRRKHRDIATDGNNSLTLEELAQFDGQDGRAAWFAYQGVIYDASASPRWKSGMHMGRHKAGSDLTAQLAQAPHNEEVLQALPKVGRLRTEPSGLTPPQRIFYTIAYMNLTFVLVIIAILTCWRWL